MGDAGAVKSLLRFPNMSQMPNGSQLGGKPSMWSIA